MAVYFFNKNICYFILLLRIFVKIKPPHGQGLIW